MAGTTFTWTATTPSAWTSSSNWSPVGIPGAADTAVVPSGSVLVNAGTVSATDASIGGSLTAPQPGKGTIAVSAGAEMLVSDALAVWSGSTLSVDSVSSVDIGTSGSRVAGNVVIDNGHSLVGDGLLQASVVNNGTIDSIGTLVNGPGILEISGTVGGTGTLSLLPNSILKLDGAVANSQTINFASGGPEILILTAPPATFSTPINGLNLGDRIEFGGITQITNAAVTSPGTVTAETNLGSIVLNKVTFAPGANQSFGWYVDAATGYWAIQVAPPNLNWTGAAGDNSLATATNWAPTATPTAADTINFGTSAGSTLVGAATALNAFFSGLGNWVLQGATLTLAGEPSPPYQPFALGDNGQLTVNGGTLLAGGSSDIDANQGATMIAQGGAQVSFQGTALGNSPGNAGYLLVTGSGTTWRNVPSTNPTGDGGYLLVGWAAGTPNGPNGGAGHVTITAGAAVIDSAGDTLGANAGSEGDLTISAAGSLSDNGIGVGVGGTGTLSINGGTITSTGFSDVGGNAGGSGTVTLSSGGLWNAQQLNIGNSGSGTLAVNGGTIAASAQLIIGANSGAVGTATIGSGGTIKANGTFDALGNNAGSNGSLVINSGGQFQISGTNFAVGNNAGSTGSLVINTGGTLAFTGTAVATTVLNIGRAAAASPQPAAVGTALVTGTGALLTTNGSPLEVGHSGVGVLTVSQGASVAVGTPDSNLDFGLGIAQSGGTGSVTVTDPGSTFTLTGFGFDARGGNGALTVENSGTFQVNDSTNGGGFNIGVGRGAGPSAPTNVGGNGVAVVTGKGLLNINSSSSGIGVGGNGTNGVLTVDNSGTVLAGTGLTIGSATSAGGTIYGGTGALNIGTGGLVRVSNPTLTGYAIVVGGANSSIGGPTNADSGAVLVSGTGALLDGSGAGIAVGQLSPGSLVISHGGEVVSGTPNNATFAAVGVGRQATGSITITDPGSSETANGAFYVGRAGAGALTVENHGSLNVGVDGLGNGGLIIGGAGLANGSTLFTGGSGSGLVTGSGDIFSTQNVTVGENGTDGALNINGGGTVEAGQQFLIGSSLTLAAGNTIITSGSTAVVAAPTIASATGNITVGAGGVLKADGTGVAVGTPVLVVGNGPDSTGNLNASGTSAIVDSIGQLDVGDFGSGQLLVQNQATVTTGNSSTDPSAGFDVAAGAGGAGTATVQGTSSLLTNKGRFVVGDSGVGSLSILSGGTVATTPGTVAGLDGADVAAQAGSDGSNVNVTGSGSDWQITGSLVVGDVATGALAIAAGGTVSAGSLDAGKNAGATGNVSVVGTGSALTLSGLLTVGNAGSADMSILNDATVNAQNVLVGVPTTGSGNLDIEGNASRLIVSNDVTIGANGVVNLGNNTTLTVTNNLVNDGFLLGNGVIDPATITNKAGKSIGGSGGIVTATVEIDNAGTLFATNGTETIVAPLIHLGTLTGTGVLDVQTNGNLDLQAAVASDQKVVFDDGMGRLTVEQPGSFDAIISNFIVGDVIAVHAPSTATFSQSGSIVSVINNGVTLGALTFASTTDATTAVTTPGALVDVCFCAGTAIATPDGYVLVERLTIGDRVLTHSGAVREIIWIGTGKVMATRGRRNAATPVIVRKGAVADNVPHRDLHVTKGHALFIDGVLIPVENLVNHRTIAWDDRAQEVTIYHIELATHDVLLANGAPAESYRDDGNRWLFQNSNPGWTLPPQAPCAPILTGGPIVDEIWRRLLDRAGPYKSPPLTDEAGLHLLVDGARLDPIERSSERCAFRLPGRPRIIRLRSRSVIPQELGSARDARCLGVAVRRIVLAQARRQQALDADATSLVDGWHSWELDNGIRWTDGDAALPVSFFSGMSGSGMLIVHLGPPTQYLDDGEDAILAA